MSFENEHACRLIPPKKGAQVDTIRMTRTADDPEKDYDVVMQRENEDAPFEDQAFRYDSENWTVEQARAHCQAHDGILFEEASGDSNPERSADAQASEPTEVSPPDIIPQEDDEEDAQASQEAVQAVEDPGPLSIDPEAVVHSEECFRSYMGIWAIEPRFFQECVAAVREGRLAPVPAAVANVNVNVVNGDPKASGPQARAGDKPFELANPTTAMIRVEGTMMKASSKWGGTSTVKTRRLLRQAAADPDIDQIAMVWDTPGGHVDGTKELADDIHNINANHKPVHSYVSDLCASAGLECASQSQSVSANEPARIGSFGTFGVLRDLSKAARVAGIKDTVVATGQHKGYSLTRSVRGFEKKAAAVEIADLQRQFDAQMARGRGFNRAQLEELRTGEVWIAKKAKARGLIDRIESFDAFLDRITQAPKRAARRRRVSVEAEIQRKKLQSGN